VRANVFYFAQPRDNSCHLRLYSFLNSLETLMSHGFRLL
jgi:hypothetical protein